MMWDYGAYDIYYDSFGFRPTQVGPPDGGVIDAGSVGDAAPPNKARLPGPFASLLSKWGARIQQSCPPMVDFKDDDGDGIPASYEATFECTDQRSTDRTTTLTGDLKIEDADDEAPNAGFTVTYDNLVVKVVANDGTIRSRALNGTSTIMPTGNGSYQVSNDLAIAFVTLDAGQPQIQGSIVSKEGATYTPDANVNMADPFASGIVDLTGSVVLDRTFQGTQVTRDVTRSTNPKLHWNRDCRRQNPNLDGFDSGTLVYQDTSGGALQLQYNGCAAPTVTQR
jgi:hypothetical protein